MSNITFNPSFARELITHHNYNVDAPAKDTTTQNPNVSSGATSRIPTDKSSALSALVARNQTPNVSAGAPAENNKPPLKSSTDTLTHDEIVYVNSHLDDLQGAIVDNAIRNGGGCELAYQESARNDIYRMIDAIQKRSSITMPLEDIQKLMKCYNNTVGELGQIGQGVDGKIQSEYVDAFVQQYGTPQDRDALAKCAQEVGVDPKLLAQIVEQAPYKPVSADQMRAFAETLKSDQVDPSQYLSSPEVEKAIEDAVRKTGVDKDQLFKIVSDICNSSKLPLSAWDMQLIGYDVVINGHADREADDFMQGMLNDIAHNAPI